MNDVFRLRQGLASVCSGFQTVRFREQLPFREKEDVLLKTVHFSMKNKIS